MVFVMIASMPWLVVRCLGMESGPETRSKIHE